MKLYTKILPLFLVFSAVTSVWAHEKQEESVTMPAAVKQAHACHCGPIEHWFHKVCVQRYIAQFPECGLQANYDTEGVAENIIEAINLFAADIIFVAQDGSAIIPELNAKGKLILPLGKNPDVKLCKQILRKVDATTDLPAQVLYQEWTQLLQAMKFVE